MKKIAEILFVLLLCIFVWQGGNRINDGGNEKTTVYEGIPEEGKMMTGKTIIEETEVFLFI